MLIPWARLLPYMNCVLPFCLLRRMKKIDKNLFSSYGARDKMETQPYGSKWVRIGTYSVGLQVVGVLGL